MKRLLCLTSHSKPGVGVSMSDTVTSGGETVSGPVGNEDVFSVSGMIATVYGIHMW